MIIHNTEECEKWLKYKSVYSIAAKAFMFEPEIDEHNIISWNVVDISGKGFQHNQQRFMDNINKILNNYPRLNDIIDKLHIFFCPKPSADTANACASDDFMCYFARSTQIPWCMTDYITAHELGHYIQFNLCATRKDKFREYLELRNAEKGMCYDVFDHYDREAKNNIYVDKEDFLFINGTSEEKKKYSTWDMSPNEWFAEDFRYLFGTDQGDKFWGLPIPEPDDRIKEFMLSI